MHVHSGQHSKAFFKSSRWSHGNSANLNKTLMTLMWGEEIIWLEHHVKGSFIHAKFCLFPWITLNNSQQFSIVLE